jgi:hypothetical protein
VVTSTGCDSRLPARHGTQQLAEAMLRAGVRFAMIQDLICDLYPSADW